MTYLKKGLLVLLLTTITSSAFASSDMFSGSFSYAKDVPAVSENVMTITITINSSSYIKMKDIPKKGFLDVYSVLGRKVTSIDLAKSQDGIYIDLTKGIYVFKAGQVTQKVVIKDL